jgi:hypothetical protein
MNEQELADLFSEQLDHLLQGNGDVEFPEIDDLPDLLNLGTQFSQIGFKPSLTAQAAFESQVASWFGLLNGGSSPMTILGLSKIWFISIIVVAVVVITGVGLTAVIATSMVIIGADVAQEATATKIATPATPGTPVADTDDDDDDGNEPPATMAAETPVVTTTTTTTATVEPPVTVTATLEVTATATLTGSVTPTTTVTPEASVTPIPGVIPGFPPFISIINLQFINSIHIPTLCQGAYITQRTLGPKFLPQTM